MAVQQRAEKAKPWLALADATALLISFGLAVGLMVWLRGHRIGPGIGYWWSWEGAQQAQAFALLGMLTVATF